MAIRGNRYRGGPIRGPGPTLPRGPQFTTPTLPMPGTGTPPPQVMPAQPWMEGPFPGGMGGTGPQTPPPSGCPRPEEHIQLANNDWILAGELKVGDEVITSKEPQKVTFAKTIEDSPRREVLFTEGDSIVTSPSHPYFVKDKGFVDVEDLKEGDAVGDLIVSEVKPFSDGPVIHISVDKAQTYMLRGGTEENPVPALSHNKSPQPPQPPWPPVMPPPVIDPPGPETPPPTVPSDPVDNNNAGIKAEIERLKRKKDQLMRQVQDINMALKKLKGKLGIGGLFPQPIPVGPTPVGPTPVGPTPVGPTPVGPPPIPQPTPPPFPFPGG